MNSNYTVEPETTLFWRIVYWAFHIRFYDWYLKYDKGESFDIAEFYESCSRVYRKDRKVYLQPEGVVCAS